MRSTKAQGLLLASALRTAATTSADQTNLQTGVIVYVDVTVRGTVGSLTPSIQGKDPASGKYYNILTATAITAIGVYTYYVGTGDGTNSALTKSACVGLPSPWRVSVAVGGTEEWTYSIGYQQVA